MSRTRTSAPPPSMPDSGVRSPEPFDRGARAWAEFMGSPLGQLRVEVASRQLKAHLPQRPQEALDVGGGTGETAVRLVREGHEVTVLDSSAGMLALARRHIGSLNPPERPRLHFVESALESLPPEWIRSQFALVVCHCTLEYISDERPAWPTLFSLLRPGGILPLIVPNREANALHLAVRGLISRARDALDGARGEPDLLFNVKRRTYDAARVTRKLGEVGFQTVATYGLRVAVDLASEEAIAADYPAAVAFEVAAGSMPQYVRAARYLHVIAKRPGGGAPPQRKATQYNVGR